MPGEVRNAPDGAASNSPAIPTSWPTHAETPSPSWGGGTWRSRSSRVTQRRPDDLQLQHHYAVSLGGRESPPFAASAPKSSRILGATQDARIANNVRASASSCPTRSPITVPACALPSSRPQGVRGYLQQNTLGTAVLCAGTRRGHRPTHKGRQVTWGWRNSLRLVVPGDGPARSGTDPGGSPPVLSGKGVGSSVRTGRARL